MFLIVWLFVVPVATNLGYTFNEVNEGMMDQIKIGMGSILILLTVGAMIATWIAAGTVPSIICYGLQIISPSAFLLTTFLLCSVVSVACGTSWGTLGTAGIAMYAVGESMGIPVGMTLGAAISGSYLGDMISPMSDSTNAASAACGTDLITHCKELARLAIPTVLISVIFYYFLGRQFASSAFDATYVNSVVDSLKQYFEVGLITIIPVVVLLGMLLFKKPAMLSMLTSAVTAILVSIMHQGTSASSALTFFWSGYKIETGEDFLDILLNRGGVQGMFSTACFMLFSLGMIGAFKKVGILDAIIHPIANSVKNVTHLIGISQLISIVANTMGSNTFSLLMTGSLMSPAFKEYKLHPTNLSKAINATSTVFCVFIPWNPSGVFVYGLFGVGTLTFAPYSIFAYVMPLMAFLAAVVKYRVIPADIDLEGGEKYIKIKQ